MGRYYKSTDKASMVVRPVLPKKFILKDGKLLWDDTDAVYDAGTIEYSDGHEWEMLLIFPPDEEKATAMQGKYDYRMRVKYNAHWSIYLRATEVKPVEEPDLVPIVKKKVLPRNKK